MAKTAATHGEEHDMTVSRSYAVVLEPSSAGGFVVTVPALPEVGTQGETVEEALEMARDAIALALSVRREEGEEIPPDDAPVLERVHVQIEMDQMELAKGVMKRRHEVLRELGNPPA